MMDDAPNFDFLSLILNGHNKPVKKINPKKILVITRTADIKEVPSPLAPPLFKYQRSSLFSWIASLLNKKDESKCFANMVKNDFMIENSTSKNLSLIKEKNEAEIKTNVAEKGVPNNDYSITSKFQAAQDTQIKKRALQLTTGPYLYNEQMMLHFALNTIMQEQAIFSQQEGANLEPEIIIFNEMFFGKNCPFDTSFIF